VKLVHLGAAVNPAFTGIAEARGLTEFHQCKRMLVNSLLEVLVIFGAY